MGWFSRSKRKSGGPEVHVVTILEASHVQTVHANTSNVHPDRILAALVADQQLSNPQSLPSDRQTAFSGLVVQSLTRPANSLSVDALRSAVPLSSDHHPSSSSGPSSGSSGYLYQVFLVPSQYLTLVSSVLLRHRHSSTVLIDPPAAFRADPRSRSVVRVENGEASEKTTMVDTASVFEYAPSPAQSLALEDRSPYP
eukprot:ANDGO_04220.mRNA.1 hypothetical protein